MKIRGIKKRVTKENINSIVKNADIILDGTDNMQTRFLINDVSIKNDIPWIYAGVYSTVGMIMGIGVGLAFLRWVRRKLAPPTEDQESGSLNTVGLLFLLLVMMWNNLYKNVRSWAQGSHIPEHLFGVQAEWWFLMVGLMLSAMVLVAIIRHHHQELPLAPSSAFGRGQFLFLIILWVAIAGAFTQAFPAMRGKGTLFVHVTFWITGGICSLIMLGLSGKPKPQREAQLTAFDHFWRPGIRYWISWLLVPVLIVLLAYLTVSLDDEPLSNSHLRFTKTLQP